MKKRLSALLTAGAFSLCLSAQCRLLLDASLDSTLNFLWEHYLENGEARYKDNYRKKYEQGKQAAAKPRFDSLFRATRDYLIEKLGEDIFCRRVDMDLWTAYKFYRTNYTIQYRFFFDDPNKDNESSFQQYSFYFEPDKKTGAVLEAHFPNVPDCRNNPALCNFQVANEKQALQIAEEAGFLDGMYHNVPRRGHNQWVWEVEKLLNDDCKAQKILIDMYTGEVSYSDYYNWWGCTPLKDKVGKSPIVIEGTPLEEEGGYYHKGNIWSRRLVEVNKIFKGDVKAGVVEVITQGGQMGNRFQSLSHGQIGLPGKGETAIFFLQPPTPSDDPWNGSGVDSLSPYPVYYVYGYEPLVLYPGGSQATSFTLDIERHTYQAIEAAAGQQRQNRILPAVDKEGFETWAIEHNLSVPIRELGLEYVIIPQNPAKYQDSISFYIGINSPASHSYLARGRFMLQYNPAVFGDSIVSKGRLDFQPMQQSAFYAENYSFGKRLPPASYLFSLKDRSDSTFQVEFRRPEGDTSLFQVTPFQDVFTTMEGLPLIRLSLPIRNREESMNIGFVTPETEYGHYRFDFEHNKEVHYRFVRAQGGITLPASAFREPQVTGISPGTLRYWSDTLAIQGHNLSGDGAEIMVWCEREGRSLYCPLPPNCIILHTDTEIRFRIPDTIITNNNPAGYPVSWRPAGGSVKVVKEVMGWRLSGESEERVFLR